MTKYCSSNVGEEDCVSYMRKCSFPESNREAIIDALKNLHAVYSKKYSKINLQSATTSDYHDDLQNDYQESKHRWQTPEDELIRVNQYLDENDNLVKEGIYSDDSLKLCDIKEASPKSSKENDLAAAHNSGKLKTKKWRKMKRNEEVIPQVSSTTVASQTTSGQVKLNAPEIPFITGKSTSKSHSMSANLQEVLALMRTHNLSLCKTPAHQRSCRCRVTPRSCGSNVSVQSQNPNPASRTGLEELRAQIYDEYTHLRVKHEQSGGLMGNGNNNKMNKYLQRLKEEMTLKDTQIRAISEYLSMESSQNVTPSVSAHRCHSGDLKGGAKKSTQFSRGSTHHYAPNKQRADFLRNLKDIQQSLK